MPDKQSPFTDKTAARPPVLTVHFFVHIICRTATRAPVERRDRVAVLRVAPVREPPAPPGGRAQKPEPGHRLDPVPVQGRLARHAVNVHRVDVARDQRGDRVVVHPEPASAFDGAMSSHMCGNLCLGTVVHATLHQRIWLWVLSARQNAIPRPSTRQNRDPRFMRHPKCRNAGLYRRSHRQTPVRPAPQQRPSFTANCRRFSTTAVGPASRNPTPSDHCDAGVQSGVWESGSESGAQSGSRNGGPCRRIFRGALLHQVWSSVVLSLMVLQELG